MLQEQDMLLMSDIREFNHYALGRISSFRRVYYGNLFEHYIHTPFYPPAHPLNIFAQHNFYTFGH